MRELQANKLQNLLIDVIGCSNCSIDTKPPVFDASLLEGENWIRLIMGIRKLRRKSKEDRQKGKNVSKRK